ncbi:hypothetical protein [Streptomyces himalayensis]|uniref:Uncharacterized protein n=1 Tax=Streptomyces himalayensis subsp. himalayensis TaxID=2756131 RepID=A0A7W0DK39_9ACTN|nr:hypothetical protein [Streptomyces himalayensis]MBA2946511.1 hypothetical protein [Streptomyces himalayensis subsp. himalayensis]
MGAGLSEFIGVADVLEVKPGRAGDAVPGVDLQPMPLALLMHHPHQRRVLLGLLRLAGEQVRQLAPGGFGSGLDRLGQPGAGQEPREHQVCDAMALSTAVRRQ